MIHKYIRSVIQDAIKLINRLMSSDTSEKTISCFCRYINKRDIFCCNRRVLTFWSHQNCAVRESAAIFNFSYPLATNVQHGDVQCSARSPYIRSRVCECTAMQSWTGSVQDCIIVSLLLSCFHVCCFAWSFSMFFVIIPETGSYLLLSPNLTKGRHVD